MTKRSSFSKMYQENSNKINQSKKSSISILNYLCIFSMKLIVLFDFICMIAIRYFSYVLLSAFHLFKKNQDKKRKIAPKVLILILQSFSFTDSKILTVNDLYFLYSMGKKNKKVTEMNNSKD